MFSRLSMLVISASRLTPVALESADVGLGRERVLVVEALARLLVLALQPAHRGVGVVGEARRRAEAGGGVEALRRADRAREL